MFEHPEGQPHPRPPKNIRELKDLNYSEELFGKSSVEIKKFLKQKNTLQSCDKISLTKQIRKFIYHKESRAEYVDFAWEYLSKKRPSSKKVYDITLIGAGIHAAIFVYTIKKINPGLKILILEKSNNICSTFYDLGDSLVLNSPTFSKVGLNSNIFPEHFIQTSDFDELSEKPFPTAKHLYELAVMVFFHSDADIVFEFDVKEIKGQKTNHLIVGKNLKLGNKFELSARNIIVANGMGQPKKGIYKKDRSSKKIVSGDEFIRKSFNDSEYFQRIKNKKIAVVGAGDTANCVMEYLLPLVYPNYYYGFYRKDQFLPDFIYWFGQSAKTIQDYFFANKSRYCHSGGVIEFFWNEETPFELSTEIWKKTKELISCTGEKLVSIEHKSKCLNLKTEEKNYNVDLVIDCTGRMNKLCSKLIKGSIEYIEADISLDGGHWDEDLERFIPRPRTLFSKKVTAKIKNKNIFFLGSSFPLEKMIDDDEAKNGSLKYQEERRSLTNSKWSLEHTLPRTVSFAKNYKNILDI